MSLSGNQSRQLSSIKTQGVRPLSPFDISLNYSRVTASEQADGTLSETLTDYLNTCKGMMEWEGGSVAYPIPAYDNGGRGSTELIVQAL
jgi:hypothetical protein